ncbi:MAG TPA: hypothetical protein VKV74_12765 [Bryobacteraceae bacterium]|nr:hypothetical protein [Bryobacteraceae bacterium]
METSASKRLLPLGILLLSLGIGGGLRFSGLGTRSISHPEIYVPGIHLPRGLSEPSERDTIFKVLTGTFSSDTHPPGYYLAMFPWTRITGASLAAIRLPSAILGFACIPLLYILGAITGKPLSGSLAALLLAASGYHVFWSQVARMFAQACFLGLAGTVLLLWIVGGARHRTALEACYVALLLAGVATHVFFWTLFATHILWAFFRAWGEDSLPDICRAQLLALILGSPFIAFLAYQSGNTVAELSGNGMQFLAAYLPFAFLLPTTDSGFFASAVPLTENAAGWGLRTALLLAGAFLLAAGWRETLRGEGAGAGDKLPAGAGGRWRLGWILAGAGSTGAILGFLYMTRYVDPGQLRETIQATRILTILPAILTLAAMAADSFWGRLPAAGTWLRRLGRPAALPALLAVLPFALLAAASRVRPLLNQRGLLFTAPYMLLLLSIGLLSLRGRIWRVGLGMLAGIGCAASVLSYSRMNVGPVDYGRLAAAISPEIQSRDLIFIRKAWYATPLFYYFTPERYHLGGPNFGQAVLEHPDSRVWVVLINGDRATGEMEAALSGYRLARTIRAADGQALLYERGKP